MTISQVRHVMGERVAAKILRLMKLGGGGRSTHLCPFCATAMLIAQTEDPPLQLDACRSCNVVWLDFPTYESLPQLTVETMNSIPMQATEIIAITRLQELKAKMAAEEELEKKKKRRHRLSGARDDDDAPTPERA